MVSFDCFYTEPPHQHEYPDDWTFGGPFKTDPRADQRWESTVYVYFDDKMREVWRTVAPLCDDEALDNFTIVAQIRGANPTYIAVKRPGERQPTMMPWRYVKQSDTVYPLETVNA